MLGNLVRNHAPAERNGELVEELGDAQGGAEDGPSKGKRRVRSKVSMEKGRGRNIKIPDGLYDQLCLYARRTKVRVVAKDKPGKEREWSRSMTVSEAVCKFIAAGLPKKLRIVEDDAQNLAESA
jgi:hypothetical protein